MQVPRYSHLIRVEASLEALGYISQDMPASVMERSAMNPISEAILHGIRAYESSFYLRLAAFNALLNTLEFAKTVSS